MTATASPASAPLRVEYCGEWHDVADGTTFTIGRSGDLDVDDNPYLHRRFLELRQHDGMWTIANIGQRLGATVADVDRLFSAYIGPGVVLPLVFRHSVVHFGAGPTTYELAIFVRDAQFEGLVSPAQVEDGTMTVGKLVLTRDQRLLIVALAEHALRRGGSGASHLPTTAEAAARLGWTTTKFTRKLDNVCQKFKASGVRGLHGEQGNLASNRRARLVEYALTARVVTATDLELLPEPT